MQLPNLKNKKQEEAIFANLLSARRDRIEKLKYYLLMPSHLFVSPSSDHDCPPL
jgi:hypothetical protein